MHIAAKCDHIKHTYLEFLVKINCTLFTHALLESIHIPYNATLLEEISDLHKLLISYDKNKQFRASNKFLIRHNIIQN